MNRRYASRRERLAAERRVRRERHPPLRTALAAVSAAALLGVAGLPLLAPAPAPDAAAAVGIVPSVSQAAVRDGVVTAPGPRDGYSGIAPAPVARSGTIGSELLLDTGQLTGQAWAVPVAGRITDGFGPRPDRPVAGVNAFHEGTDLATSCGTPIHAATDGTVVQAGWNGTYGEWILLDHGDGIQTGYAHIAAGGIEVAVAQTVTAGQEIAVVGATGAATGCHLHFETRIGGQAVDAVPFMARRGIAIG